MKTRILFLSLITLILCFEHVNYVESSSHEAHETYSDISGMNCHSISDRELGINDNGMEIILLRNKGRHFEEKFVEFCFYSSNLDLDGHALIYLPIYNYDVDTIKLLKHVLIFYYDKKNSLNSLSPTLSASSHIGSPTTNSTTTTGEALSPTTNSTTTTGEAVSPTTNSTTTREALSPLAMLPPTAILPPEIPRVKMVGILLPRVEMVGILFPKIRIRPPAPAPGQPPPPKTPVPYPGPSVIPDPVQVSMTEEEVRFLRKRRKRRYILMIPIIIIEDGEVYIDWMITSKGNHAIHGNGVTHTFTKYAVFVTADDIGNDRAVRADLPSVFFSRLQRMDRWFLRRYFKKSGTFSSTSSYFSKLKDGIPASVCTLLENAILLTETGKNRSPKFRASQHEQLSTVRSILLRLSKQPKMGRKGSVSHSMLKKSMRNCIIINPSTKARIMKFCYPDSKTILVSDADAHFYEYGESSPKVQVVVSTDQDALFTLAVASDQKQLYFCKYIPGEDCKYIDAVATRNAIVSSLLPKLKERAKEEKNPFSLPYQDSKLENWIGAQFVSSLHGAQDYAAPVYIEREGVSRKTLAAHTICKLFDKWLSSTPGELCLDDFLENIGKMASRNSMLWQLYEQEQNDKHCKKFKSDLKISLQKAGLATILLTKQGDEAKTEWKKFCGAGDEQELQFPEIATKNTVEKEDNDSLISQVQADMKKYIDERIPTGYVQTPPEGKQKSTNEGVRRAINLGKAVSLYPKQTEKLASNQQKPTQQNVVKQRSSPNQKKVSKTNKKRKVMNLRPRKPRRQNVPKTPKTTFSGKQEDVIMTEASDSTSSSTGTNIITIRLDSFRKLFGKGDFSELLKTLLVDEPNSLASTLLSRAKNMEHLDIHKASSWKENTSEQEMLNENNPAFLRRWYNRIAATIRAPLLIKTERLLFNIAYNTLSVTVDDTEKLTELWQDENKRSNIIFGSLSPTIQQEEQLFTNNKKAWQNAIRCLNKDEKKDEERSLQYRFDHRESYSFAQLRTLLKELEQIYKTFHPNWPGYKLLPEKSNRPWRTSTSTTELLVGRRFKVVRAVLRLLRKNGKDCTIENLDAATKELNENPQDYKKMCSCWKPAKDGPLDWLTLTGKPHRRSSDLGVSHDIKNSKISILTDGEDVKIMVSVVRDEYCKFLPKGGNQELKLKIIAMQGIAERLGIGKDDFFKILHDRKTKKEKKEIDVVIDQKEIWKEIKEKSECKKEEYCEKILNAETPVVGFIDHSVITEIKGKNWRKYPMVTVDPGQVLVLAGSMMKGDSSETNEDLVVVHPFKLTSGAYHHLTGLNRVRDSIECMSDLGVTYTNEKRCRYRRMVEAGKRRLFHDIRDSFSTELGKNYIVVVEGPYSNRSGHGHRKPAWKEWELFQAHHSLVTRVNGYNTSQYCSRCGSRLEEVGPRTRLCRCDLDQKEAKVTPPDQNTKKPFYVNRDIAAGTNFVLIDISVCETGQRPDRFNPPGKGTQRGIKRPRH